MKKIFFTILSAVLLAVNAFAIDLKKTNSNFSGLVKNEFAGAFEIKSVGNYNEQKVTDTYKAIENQLPIAAKRTFAKMLQGYQVTKAVHFTGDDGDAFYISAENEKESIILKIDDTLDVSIFKQIKK